MMTHYYFVEPLDVLIIRGNKSFGGAGQHGESVMSPWPSLFAGAFRSALLGDDADKLSRFVSIGTDKTLDEPERCTRIREVLGDALFAALGTPETPGEFRIAWLSLGILSSVASKVGGERIVPVMPLTADLASFDDKDVPPLAPRQPAPHPGGSAASCELPLTACLRVAKQIKPEGGRWLDGDGLSAHLVGNLPDSTIKTEKLYKRETRLGIALNTESRTAEAGALYTTEAVSFVDSAFSPQTGKGVGFLVGIAGDHDQMPEQGLLRLGGDGKGARYRRIDFKPPPEPLPKVGGRFRIVLATPGIFSGGWLPERVMKQVDGSYRLQGNGFTARLVCAAVNRHDVISGWDLANWQPKTAQRVAPAGSVYWFDDLQGEPRKLAEWVTGGIWGENADAQRRAEGFNRAWLAAWPNN